MTDYPELRKLQDIIDNQADRILDLEAALREIANPSTVAGMHEQDRDRKLQGIARAALAPEQDK